jgi:outer membrane protein TolC
MFIQTGPLARLKKPFSSALLITIVFATSAMAQQMTIESTDAAVTPLSIEDAVAIALNENAGLAARGALASALEEVPSQAGALADPMIGISAMNFPTDTFDFDQEPMTQLQLSVSQSLPYPGKRQLMRDAAEHEAEAARSRIDERVLTLSADVRSGWWRLFYLDRTIEIIDENRFLMRDFVEVAQTKYRVGSGLQSDVLLAQLELSRLMDRRLRAESMRSAMQSALNQMLNRPGGMPITLPSTPPNESLPQLPPNAELLQRAVAERPELAAEQALVDAARARLDLANKNLRPDFRVGVAYGVRDGRNPTTGESRPDFLSLNFGVTVPLYSESKQRSAVEQRTHEVSQRRYELNDTLRSIEADVSRYRFDYLSAIEQVELGRGAIIPQAQQTVASMLAAYQTNQVDFLNVVNTQINLFSAQINYWEALSTAKSALAKLAAAVGQENLYE